MSTENQIESKLPKETFQRIHNAGAKYSVTKKDEELLPALEGYCIGACAEAERALVLVDALEKIRKDSPIGSWFYKTCDKALSSYNKTDNNFQ